MNFAQIATCGAMLIALSAQSAAAAPALATSNVNMRQGPGTNYPIIITIPGGSNVEVSGCQVEWCAVVWQGRRGYAIATSLDHGGGPPPPGAVPQGPVPAYRGAPPPPPPGYYGPPAYYGPPGYYARYYYGYGPYYGRYYGPYWRRRWWW